MISRNYSRRLEQLEERMLPPENRVVLRVLFMNKDYTEPSGGYIVDPWSRRDLYGNQRTTRTPMSPRSRGR
jgi:hypothetical protein